MRFLQQHSETLYFISLLVIAAGMPLSVFLMSVGGIMLVVTFFLHGNAKYKFQHALSNRVVLAMALFFLLHLAALIYTTDFDFALKDIRVKLPLLAYTVIIFSMPRPNEKKVNVLLALVVFSVFVSTVISLLIYKKIITTEKDISDVRNISPFISHIRLSLLICTSIAILAWFSWKHKKFILPAVLLSGWFAAFLYVLESITGFFILSALVTFGCFCLFFYFRNKLYRALFLALALTMVIIPSWHIYHRFNLFFTPVESLKDLDVRSAAGEPYLHETNMPVIECGRYINIYIAPQELKTEWEKRSNIPYEGRGKKNNFIRHTLVRYLTSMDLRKDREGISKLSDTDIRNIENGIANTAYLSENNINRRLDQVFFEMEIYFKGLNPSGSSVAQRLEFWKTGWQIFKDNKWIGVGTGDSQLEFDKRYEMNRSKLDKQHRKRSHNQFLAVMVAFGLSGLIVFLLAIGLPVLKALRNQNILYLSFFIIAFLSFLTEDTLETQAGATFFAFLNAVFLFLIPGKILRKNTEAAGS